MIFKFFRFFRSQDKVLVVRIVLNDSSYKYLKINFCIFQNSNFKGHKWVKLGYLRQSCFLHFLGRKIRYNFRNCTKTFFIHFSKFQLQGTQRVDFKGLIRGICDIHDFRVSRPQNKIQSSELY